jgi:predicted transporter
MIYPYLRSPTIAGVPAALPAISAATTLIVLSTWFFVTTDFPYSAIDTAVEEAESPITAWLRSGSLSTGIHVVTAALVVIAVMNAARSRGLGAGDESGGG